VFNSPDGGVALGCSFVLCGGESSLLWTPAHRRQQAQCAYPWERGGELVGVCATCRKDGLIRREQLVRCLLITPHQGVAYCLTSLAGTYAATAYQRLRSAGPGGRLFSVARGQSRPSTWATSATWHSRHLDVANQDAGNGHRF